MCEWFELIKVHWIPNVVYQRYIVIHKSFIISLFFFKGHSSFHEGQTPEESGAGEVIKSPTQVQNNLDCFITNISLCVCVFNYQKHRKELKLPIVFSIHKIICIPNIILRFRLLRKRKVT